MDYVPKSVDTSSILLDEELLELTEFLAKNTHDVWAQERYQQGWKYGMRRNDDKKLHPCLIPYTDLPEHEKILDRNTAIEALKTIVALGYQLEMPELKFKEGIYKSNKNLISFIEGQNLSLEQLYHIWKNHEIRSWARASELYKGSCERALEFGEPLLAYNIILEGIKFFPDDIRLMQLQGLSLARIGASEEANKVLLSLYQDFKDKSEETLGMLGRTYKDLSYLEKNSELKKENLKQAINFYEMSFKLYQSIWAGVNLASLFLFLGEKKKASLKGIEILKISKRHDGDKDYWYYASIGEAFLVQEKYKDALKFYQKAMLSSNQKIGAVNSTRKNALMVMRALGTKIEIFKEIEKCLSVPKIIIFTGHRIDDLDRTAARFPASKEKVVYQRILKYLKELGPAVGYCSAANGSDILFLEAMKELQNPCHIVIPFSKEKFIKDSVCSTNGTSWESRFLKICKNKENSVLELSDQGVFEKQNSYEFANSIVLGLAKLKALQLETLVFPLAVWHSDEEQKECLTGGTTQTLKSWYRNTEFLEIIDLKNLENLKTSKSIVNTDFTKVKEKKASDSRYKTKGILFSDAVNYTQLSDEEFIIFEDKVLGTVSEMSDSGKYEIDYLNTWGDALHVIFNTIESTASFALDLNQKLLEIDWLELGFKEEVKMRVAIHAGQVIETINPMSKLKHYNGSNVCRAARLEPLTPPGQVYCTQELAALIYAFDLSQFSCRFVGDLAMPKDFGIYPIFNLREAQK